MPLPEYRRATDLPYSFSGGDVRRWRARVPGIERVTVASSVDGARQRALFYAPRAEGPRPLLVVLHSWGADYQQDIDIPYAVFAARNGWVMIHPDHRGRYTRPEATASELAQRDVLDAVEYAARRADVDRSRVYLVGYSGSAMTALVLAGRFPDTWAGVVAWVPVFDLGDWYVYNRERDPSIRYVRQIAASCGGVPRPGTPAAEECRRRSPSAHLAHARGRVPVYLAVGIDDVIVPPDHALRAFNALAEPDDRLAEADLAAIARTRRVPAHLGPAPDDELYARARAPALFARTSGGATVVVFRGGHDVVFNPGLAWLARQRRAPGDGR